MINLTEIIQSAMINAISGVIANLPFFILFIWGIRFISKQIPVWVEDYWKKRENYLRLENARRYMDKQ